MNQYQYKFSVIIPVYNAEIYLKETINSIIQQTIGFEENIQLILINDGSQDNSGKICNEYQEKYPNNVVYISKENQGVSSARNEGMKYIKGKYVNFFDSDDIWELNAFEKVYDILEKNQDINILACRIEMFDARKGYHLLDYRFEEGTQVVDINEKEDYIQTNIGPVFFRYSRIKDKSFDETLKYAEDGKFVNELFLEDDKYILVADVTYFYRKRQDKSSATQMSTKNKFYCFALEGTYIFLAKNSLEKKGYVKRYFQNYIIYDMKYRFKNELEEGILDNIEKEKYIETIKELLKYVDDDVILHNRFFKFDYKLLTLKLKYGEELKEKINIKDKAIYVGDVFWINIENILNNVKISRVKNGKLYIEGNTVLDTEIMEYCYCINNEDMKKVNIYDSKNISNVFGNQVTVKRIIYKEEISLEDVATLNFAIKINNEYYTVRNRFISYSSINNFKTGYYYKDKYLITKGERKTTIKVKYRPSIFSVIGKELYYLGYLLLKRKKSKVVLQRILYWITKPFMPKNIWLFADREFMAEDSAEVVFRYTNNEENLNKRKTYFVVDKRAKDFERMKQYGNVVGYHTLKYKLLFLNAKYIISSHADVYINNEFGKSRKFYIDLYHFEYIYLTHGVLLHDSSNWLNRLNKNFELNVVTSPMEYDSILAGKYYLEPKNLIKTGLPRHDNLFNDEIKEENKILLMPSWRSKLAGELITGTQRRKYNPDFKNSEYYIFYHKLFNDTRLQKVLKQYGYKMKFCIHPSFREQKKDFKGNEYVQIAIDVNSQYETLTSKFLITDYSSAACDFAYVRKPVIYANFDSDHIDDIHYYKKGYFDYDRDGFGPNCKDYEETVNEIIKTIESGCKMEEKYIDRCDRFFYYKDNHNAQRVYKAIIEHEKEDKDNK